MGIGSDFVDFFFKPMKNKCDEFRALPSPHDRFSPLLFEIVRLHLLPARQRRSHEVGDKSQIVSRCAKTWFCLLLFLFLNACEIYYSISIKQKARIVKLKRGCNAVPRYFYFTDFRNRTALRTFCSRLCRE